MHFTSGQKFRQEFSKFSEIRALFPPGTNVIALTATENCEHTLHFLGP